MWRALVIATALFRGCIAVPAQELFVTFDDVAAGTTDSAINMGDLTLGGLFNGAPSWIYDYLILDDVEIPNYP